jgi:hypothetical protein
MSGFVCDEALPFTVEDWKAYLMPPMVCGSAKATVQDICDVHVKFAGVI